MDKNLQSTWDQLEDAYRKEINFSKFFRSPKAIRYLKLKTLIDYETLKLNRVNEFLNSLGIKVDRPSLKIAEEIRRKIFIDESISDEMLDNCLREAYDELEKETRINYAKLKNSLVSISKKGDNYMLGWKSIFRDDIRLHIQQHFVRNPSIQDLDELLNKINSELLPATVGYTVISWYNQWVSFLIEGIFMRHKRVVPTLRKIDKVNFFFLDIPFDLKITFLPTEYVKLRKKQHKLPRNEAVAEFVEKDPLDLAKWLYENQGEPRFSDSNRIFVVFIDKSNIEESWRLKASFDLIEEKVNEFLTSKTSLPELEWTFSGKRIRGKFRTYTDVILITKMEN